jgi:hypothetical protein
MDMAPTLPMLLPLKLYRRKKRGQQEQATSVKQRRGKSDETDRETLQNVLQAEDRAGPFNY